MFTKEQQHHIHKVVFLKNKLDKIYIHLVIQGFAASMISIFIPIFLLNLGYNLSEVFFFLLIQWTTFSLFAPLIGKIIEKIGLKEVIIIKTLIFVGALISLSLINKVSIITNYYQTIAFFLGFSSCMYTLSITSLYANFMDKEKKGNETSKFIALSRTGALFGPVIGGSISMYLGFPTLLILASILLLGSVIPLSFINHNLNHPKFNFKLFISNFTKLPKTFLFLNLYGIKGFIFYIVLPISIYLSGENLNSLGMMLSGISLINILFSLWLGQKIDRIKPKLILKIGAIITSLFMITLGLLSSNNILIYFSLITGFIGVLIDIPFESRLYEQSQESKNPLTFLAFKEFSFIIGRIFLFSLLIFLSTELENSYFFGALSSILFILF